MTLYYISIDSTFENVHFNYPPTTFFGGVVLSKTIHHLQKNSKSCRNRVSCCGIVVHDVDRSGREVKPSN